jgi:DNA repair protein RadC
MMDTDLCALGAAALPTRDLVAVLLRHRPDDDELRAAERALSLVGPAREAALLAHKHGPQLLAAVELGRRAWMLPSPAGRRVRAPVDVASVVAPRAGDGGACAVALDVRLTVARVVPVAREPSDVMKAALAAGCTRVVVAERRAHAAVPTSDDEDFAERLRRAGAVVGVRVLDVVILGDDGFCSLLRLGIMRSAEPRYR